MDDATLIIIVIYSILAICSIAGFVLSYIKFGREEKRISKNMAEEKKKGEKERETTRQMLDHIDALRKTIDKNQKSMDAIERKISVLEKAVDGKLTTSSVKAIDDYQKAVEERKLAIEQEKFEWSKLVDIAKGIGWFLDRIKEDEE